MLQLLKSSKKALNIYYNDWMVKINFYTSFGLFVLTGEDLCCTTATVSTLKMNEMSLILKKI